HNQGEQHPPWSRMWAELAQPQQRERASGAEQEHPCTHDDQAGGRSVERRHYPPAACGKRVRLSRGQEAVDRRPRRPGGARLAARPASACRRKQRYGEACRRRASARERRTAHAAAAMRVAARPCCRIPRTMARSRQRVQRGRQRPVREVERQRMRARARAAVAVETALMRRFFGMSSFDERRCSITELAAEQEIPAYAAQLEEEYCYDHVWALRCPGYVRIAEVAALPEGALLRWLDRLSGLSVAAMLARIDAAPEFSSAWTLALGSLMTAPLADVDQDLLGLLAVEVWKRRRPAQ